LPIRNIQFARYHYLAAVTVFTYFATRCCLLDYKKYYPLASVKK
nr:Chain CO, SDHTT11 [Tetrahymena thermophila]